jgi:hypothetical protein
MCELYCLLQTVRVWDWRAGRLLRTLPLELGDENNRRVYKVPPKPITPVCINFSPIPPPVLGIWCLDCCSRTCFFLANGDLRPCSVDNCLQEHFGHRCV